jgi:hypothetical protein
VPELAYKIGLRLARLKYVSRAIADRADLKEFMGPPTLRIIVGVLAIGFSFLMCWPAITALGGLALYWRRPWLVVIGGPLLYGLSHVCFLTGMALSGEKYMRIFLRWLVRVGVERLLAFGTGAGGEEP